MSCKAITKIIRSSLISSASRRNRRNEINLNFNNERQFEPTADKPDSETRITAPSKPFIKTYKMPRIFR
jgi:hypothetical protein